MNTPPRAALAVTAPLLLAAGGLAQSAGPDGFATARPISTDIVVGPGEPEPAEPPPVAPLPEVGPAAPPGPPHRTSPLAPGQPEVFWTYDLETGREEHWELPEDFELPKGWTSGLDSTTPPARDAAASLLQCTFATPSPPYWEEANTQSYPWSAESAIEMQRPGSTYYDLAGSGVLIDARTAVTAGHMVHTGPGGGWMTEYASLSCRMTKGKQHFIQKVFVPKGYSDKEIDYRVMDARVDPPLLFQSGKLDSMSFLVVNDSLVDPPAQSYDLVVFFSTNETISYSDTILGTHQFQADFGPKSSIRVQLDSPPDLPPDLPAGFYFVGAYLDHFDVDLDNNFSSGDEAAQVRVF